MPGSFGHTVFRASPTCDWQRTCQVGAGKGKRCGKPTEFVKRYLYATGRAGRISSSDTWVCDVHARRFGEIHGVPILEAEPAGRRTDAARLEAKDVGR